MLLTPPPGAACARSPLLAPDGAGAHTITRHSFWNAAATLHCTVHAMHAICGAHHLIIYGESRYAESLTADPTPRPRGPMRAPPPHHVWGCTQK